MVEDLHEEEAEQDPDEAHHHGMEEGHVARVDDRIDPQHPQHLEELREADEADVLEARRVVDAPGEGRREGRDRVEDDPLALARVDDLRKSMCERDAGFFSARARPWEGVPKEESPQARSHTRRHTC